MIRRIACRLIWQRHKNETGANAHPIYFPKCRRLATALYGLKRCWEQRVHAGSLYQKLCCGVLHRSIHRSHRRQSAVTCSADREPPAWSWPSASQVSWTMEIARGYYGNVRRPWRVQTGDRLFPKMPLAEDYVEHDRANWGIVSGQKPHKNWESHIRWSQTHGNL